MSTTQEEAFEAILSHHRELSEQVVSRVARLSDVVANGNSYEVARAALVTYLANEVLVHAQAEEHTLYQAAVTRNELAATVQQMIVEHRGLALAIEELASSASARDAAELGESIRTIFVQHVARENEILLPSLMADENVDLVQLLAQMQQLTGVGREESVLGELHSATDHEAKVLTQLLLAATDLARVGEGDRACSLVASTWAALRVPRPDLANRVQVALHRLVGLVSAEPILLRSKGTRGDVSDDHVLDVRALAPAQRHETIFSTYCALDAGGAFLLVNDHDPKPLRYQFEAEYAGEFTWDSLESGPKVWRVRIGRSLGFREDATTQINHAQVR